MPYDVALVSAVPHQLYVCPLYIYVPSLLLLPSILTPSHSSRSSQSTELAPCAKQQLPTEWMKTAQSCWTLCNPMDCSLPGSSIHGILQARILEWVAIPFSRGSSGPQDRTQISLIAGGFFTIWATRGTQILTPPLPSRSSQSTELSSLCYTAAFHHGLSVLHTAVYICQATLPIIPPSPSLTVSISLSPCLGLYSCPANKFITTIFLDSIHIC